MSHRLTTSTARANRRLRFSEAEGEASTQTVESRDQSNPDSPMEGLT